MLDQIREVRYIKGLHHQVENIWGLKSQSFYQISFGANQGKGRAIASKEMLR